jgi:sterol 14-demethylase
MSPPTSPATPRPRPVSGALPGAGHSAEFLANPALFMLRAWRECGELAEFDLGGVRNILMVGPDAHEAVYRAPDDQLSAAEPYKYMVPVFGEGIQYGAPLPIERQQVKFLTHALRPDKMKGYARVIAHEVEQWIAGWGDAGERDFYDEFKELVLRTSTHCLMGSEFRAKLTEEFGALFHDLEQAISPQAVLDAHSPDAAFAKRDRARARLQDMLMESVRERRRTGGDHPDMLEVFMNARYLDGSALADELIPGMVVWIMFAGFHTSSNTASWTAVELARNPQFVPAIAREIDAVYRPGGDLSFAGLRELPALDRFIGEVLRLHPPLVTLMRQVMRDFEYKGNVFVPGTVLAISPYVSHRVPEVFPDPERFDPTRPAPASVFGSIPFGGGRRKCVGNAFALLQVQSIFCALLARYEFEPVDPPESYRDVMPSLILRPSEPCRLRYRRRRA